MRLSLFFLLILASVSLANGKSPENGSKVITGSILLNTKTAPDYKAILAALPAWKIKADSVNINDKTVVFTTAGLTVMVAYLDYQVPPAELAPALQLTWLWPNASTEVAQHKAQAVISIVGPDQKSVELYKTFTIVAACLLEHSSGSGVFLSSQYLVVPKGFYVSAARNMVENGTMPLYCWMYFGMISDKGKSTAYTYGFPEFGIKDMEVNNAAGTVQEAHGVLYEVVGIILRDRLKLTDGQEITLENEQKVTLHLTEGVVLEGKTWKVTW